LDLSNLLCLANKLGFKHNCAHYKMPANIAGLACLIGGVSHRRSINQVLVSFDASCGCFTVPWASDLRRLGHPSHASIVFSLPQFLDGGLHASIIYEPLNLFCAYVKAH